MTERWVPVVGWESHYEVSDLGRLRRTSGEIVTPYAGSCGWEVQLSRPGRRVHTGLGMFRDDPDLLGAAVDYLRRHALRSPDGLIDVDGREVSVGSSVVVVPTANGRKNGFDGEITAIRRGDGSILVAVRSNKSGVERVVPLQRVRVSAGRAA